MSTRLVRGNTIHQRMVLFVSLLVSLLVSLSSHSARADYLATFDSFTEGAIAPLNGSFVDGGITFFDLNQGGDLSRFVAEQVDNSLGAAVSAPNVLGFGGYSPGSGYGFGVVKSFQMASGTTVGSVSLDLWDANISESYGNTITLSGFRNNVLVNQTSVTLSSISEIRYLPLLLPAGIYDHFDVAGSGASNNGIFYALVDNVRFRDVIAGAAPEPSSVLLLGLFLPILGMIRRRAMASKAA